MDVITLAATFGLSILVGVAGTRAVLLAVFRVMTRGFTSLGSTRIISMGRL